MFRRVVFVVILATAVAVAGLPAGAAPAEPRPPWAKVDPQEVRERVLEHHATEGDGPDESGGAPAPKSSEPCWSRSAHDAIGDAPTLDVVSYQLTFDCSRSRFELTVRLAAPVPADWAVIAEMMIATDGFMSSSCAGSYEVAGMSDPAYPFVGGSVAASSPDCEDAVDQGSAGFRVASDRRAIRLSVRRSQIDWATSFDWGVMVAGFGPNDDDFDLDAAPDAKPLHAATFVAPFTGYWVAAGNGAVRGLGGAGSYGDASGAPLASPVVDMAARPGRHGYWLLAADGGVFSFGDAPFLGSASAMRLARGAVGIAPTPTGRGYWIATADGGVFSFGDARFYGSMGSRALNAPIVGIASTRTGLGYWLVASDGGVFGFGDARFYGSAGALHLSEPIVGMARTARGKGYWLVASDGGVFSFGDARFRGSAGTLHLPAPVVGMGIGPGGAGYRLVASDGGVFCFGGAPFHGAIPLGAPVTAIAG